ncbi:unnamed protein product, partial [Amoebophrya sp. A25]
GTVPSVAAGTGNAPSRNEKPRMVARIVSGSAAPSSSSSSRRPTTDSSSNHGSSTRTSSTTTSSTYFAVLSEDATPLQGYKTDTPPVWKLSVIDARYRRGPLMAITLPPVGSEHMFTVPSMPRLGWLDRRTGYYGLR